MAAALVGINPDLTPSSGQFGPIQETKTEEYLTDLRNLVHNYPSLQKAGYVLWPLSQADLDKKRRCERCTKVVRKGHERQKSKSLKTLPLAPVNSQRQPTNEADTANLSTPSRPSQQNVSTIIPADELANDLQTMTLKQKEPPMNCKFHSGTIRQRQWTCCNNPIQSTPCKASQFHTTKIYKPNELESNWRFLCTPTPTPVPSSSSSSSSQFVAAIVLDCEMGCAASGESELIRISAVDFFTRAVLLDALVHPSVKMAHYNTRFSGVTRRTMDDALRKNKCLRGRDAARAALWRFVGPQTVVIGHAGNGDLIALRWIHDVIVDTLLLEQRIQPRGEEHEKRRDKKQQQQQQQQQQQEKEEQDEKASEEDTQDGGVSLQTVVESAKPVEEIQLEKPKYPGLSLKALALERLKREIQVKGKGHDSLEDALATRDLLLWHIINKPKPPEAIVAVEQEGW